ncbi:hypothetical protein GUJ93_ZPchr0001g30685 [Zizania palustris]|uniref:Uncharacterized protein n=1 Tax=Zizania palustris TaxID=103762 RepID=A0A8J5VQA6_ZIZPA|nr:hypothetical protein GUJ93_ZPchr0001g30685 [Zizania palustris]
MWSLQEPWLVGNNNIIVAMFLSLYVLNIIKVKYCSTTFGTYASLPLCSSSAILFLIRRATSAQAALEKPHQYVFGRDG